MRDTGAVWLAGHMVESLNPRRIPLPRRALLRSVVLALAVLATGTVIGGGIRQTASADVSSGDRPVFIPIDPCRLADTRPATNNVGDRARPVGAAETAAFEAHGTNGDCTIPTEASALSLNITALGATVQTFLTIWPDGPRPLVASLNPAPSQPPTPNAVTAPLSSNGSFNVFNNAGRVDIVIDVNGYFAPHDHDDRYLLESEAARKADVYDKSETYAKSETYGSGEVDQRLAELTGNLFVELEEHTKPYAPVYGKVIHTSRYAGEPVGGGIAATITPFGSPMIASVNQLTDTIELHECVSATCPATIADSTTLAAAAVDDLLTGRSGDAVFAYRTVANELRIGFCTQRCDQTSSISIAANAAEANMVLGNSGPIVVYENLTTKQIVLTSCDDQTCSALTHTNLASTAGGSGEADIVATISGPIVALYTSTNPGVEVITCFFDACTSIAVPAPPRVMLVSGVGIGRNPSIAVTASGDIAVAYRDDSKNALGLVSCVTRPCKNDPATTDDDPIVEIITTSGNEGVNPTLAYDITGAAVITHQGSTGQRFLTWCPSVAFGGIGAISACNQPRISVITASGSSGDDAELLITRDGNPIVAWINGAAELYFDYFVGERSVPTPDLSLLQI